MDVYPVRVIEDAARLKTDQVQSHTDWQGLAILQRRAVVPVVLQLEVRSCALPSACASIILANAFANRALECIPGR